MTDCIFCKIIAGQIPSLVVEETNDLMIFLSLTTHPLIVPKKHIEDIFTLDDETACLIATATTRLAKAVKKGLNADGVKIAQHNGAAAGQEVFHFHTHVIPYFADGHHLPTDEATKKEVREKIKAALV